MQSLIKLFKKYYSQQSANIFVKYFFILLISSFFIWVVITFYDSSPSHPKVPDISISDTPDSDKSGILISDQSDEDDEEIDTLTLFLFLGASVLFVFSLFYTLFKNFKEILSTISSIPESTGIFAEKTYKGIQWITTSFVNTGVNFLNSSFEELGFTFRIPKMDWGDFDSSKPKGSDTSPEPKKWQRSEWYMEMIDRDREKTRRLQALMNGVLETEYPEYSTLEEGSDEKSYVESEAMQKALAIRAAQDLAAEQAIEQSYQEEIQPEDVD